MAPRIFFKVTFSMALYYNWDVINDVVYVIKSFSLISDGLGSVKVAFQYTCLKSVYLPTGQHKHVFDAGRS